jgi:RimJ/RimL family protein N-acetyltransferase
MSLNRRSNGDCRLSRKSAADETAPEAVGQVMSGPDIADAGIRTYPGAMLETERLVLRPYILDDYADYVEMVMDPRSNFPGRQELSPEDAWHRLMRYAGHWALLGYGNFAIIEKASTQYVGETGLWDAHRGMGADFDGFDEAGWFIAPWAHGLGYGFEAALLVHRWYRARIGRHRTVCMIDPANTPSFGLASKLGYRPFHQSIYRNQPVVLFERIED